MNPSLILTALVAATSQQPLYAPPPPSPFEVEVAQRLMQAVVEGEGSEHLGLLAQNVQVGRAVKYPGVPFEVERQGNGAAAFIAEVKYLTEQVGRPASVRCEQQQQACIFSYPGGGRMLMAAVTTRGGKVESTLFIYATRKLIEERARQGRR